MKDSAGGLVIGDAFRIIAFHYTAKFIGSTNSFLLNHLVVVDDVEDSIRGNNRQTGNFGVGEELVAYLDYTLPAHFVRREVVAYRHGR